MKHIFENKPLVKMAAILCLLALLIWTAMLVFFSPKAKQTPTPQSTNQPKIDPKPIPPFDESRTMKDVEAQMAFGPRVPNTPAHEEEVQYIKAQLAKLTGSVQAVPFDMQGYENTSLRLTNVLASFNPESPVRILLLTHFDSRPWADEDPDPKNKEKPVPAANDGASGTGVLLELARQMQASPPPIGVDLLFDDGEDYGKSSIDNLDHYFLGVKYYMKNKPAEYNPRFAILLDMVGDKNAEFKIEGMSMQSAPSYTQDIWKVARELNLSTFKVGQGATIEDDHLPLIQAGIPSVDIIDADLVGHNTSNPDRKYWHTTNDVISHISPATMGQVGQLLLTMIYDRLPKEMNALQ